MDFFDLRILSIYGIFFYYLTTINYKLIIKTNIIIKNIVTIIYVLDITIIYVILLYKINNGYFHLYFILMVIIGYIFGYIISKIYVNIKHKKLK